MIKAEARPRIRSAKISSPRCTCARDSRSIVPQEPRHSVCQRPTSALLPNDVAQRPRACCAARNGDYLEHDSKQCRSSDECKCGEARTVGSGGEHEGRARSEERGRRSGGRASAASGAFTRKQRVVRLHSTTSSQPLTMLQQRRPSASLSVFQTTADT